MQGRYTDVLKLIKHLFKNQRSGHFDSGTEHERKSITRFGI